MANKLLTLDDFYRCGGEWTRQPNPFIISSVVINSKLAKENSVFFAFKGEKSDGHEFISDAVHRGAKIIVYNDKAYTRQLEESEATGIWVPKQLNYMQDLANRVARKLSIPILAITGSNGKTTTKEMVSEVLSQKFKVHKSAFNYNNHLGVPLSIFDIQSDHEFVVLEFGMNHSGEIGRLCKIALPTAGLITNIGTAHIEFFGSQDRIAKAKGELFDFLAKREGQVFVNADDTYLLAQMAEIATPSIYYGIKNKEALVRAKRLQANKNACYGFEWKESKTKKTGDVQLAVPGRHNVYNALSAVAIGIKYEVRPDLISEALTQYRSTTGRMELQTHGGVQMIIDCYNANPDSMKAGLQTLNETSGSTRKLAILGDMFELGDYSVSYHREIGRYLRKLNIDGVFTIGELSELILKELKPEQYPAGLEHFTDKNELYKFLRKTVLPGDVLYFKASRGMQLETLSDKLIKQLTGKES